MNIFDRQHNKSMGECAKRVEEIIAAYEKKIMGIITRSGINLEEGFKFSDHPALKRECDKLIKELANNIRITIEKAEKTEWERSNDKNDKLVSEVIKSVSAAKNMGYMQRNLDAMEAFMGRKIAGMNLSQRVWNITKQFRGQMEAAVDIALQDHRTADELSRDVRQYLRYPDKLFRRVRDEKGVLHLSKAAKAFHPGRGVYRSSYMNARRLAATEINMAYRTSDDTRRQQLDFVVGIEVHLSNNHNCKGIPEGEFRDICDKLQGKYPKTFKFVGWHPHCRCYATSILKTREEVMEDIERRKKGLKPVKSVNEVKDVPDGFKEWVDQNQERIAKANSLPYFLSDNGQIVDGQWVMNEMAPEPSLLDNAQQRHSMRTPEQIKDIKERWKKRNEVIKGYEMTKKRAGNILNMEKEWSEVSFEQLRKAMGVVSDKSVYRASDYAELKKMLQDTIQKIKQQQTAEKALSDVIPDVHKWHKQFTLDELQEAKSKISGKLAQWTQNNDSMFSLTEMKKRLEYEVGWMERKGKKYNTWEIARDVYANRLKLVEHRIEMLNVKQGIENDISLINSSRSKVGKRITAEFDSLFKNDLTNIQALREKAAEIKTKSKQIELQRNRAAGSSGQSSYAPQYNPKSDAETKNDFLAYMRSIGKNIHESTVVIDKGFVHLQGRQHQYIYEGNSIETMAEHKQLWNHIAVSRWGRAGYIQTGNSWKINSDFRKTGVVGKIDSVAESRLEANGMTKDDLKTVKLLDKKIGEFSLPIPLVVTRYVRASALDNIFGTSFSNHNIRSLQNDIGALNKGRQLSSDCAFTSASTNELQNVFYNQFDVKLMLEVPPKTPMYFSDNYAESEIVLSRGTKLEYVSSSIGKTGGYTHLIIRCRVVQ
jgi:hypothetical protein